MCKICTYHYQHDENYRYNDTLLQRMGLQEKTLYLKDISDLGHEKSCLELFEIRKKSLHLQPQTIKTMRYSMNIITLEPKVSTGWILGCRVRYAHCSGN